MNIAPVDLALFVAFFAIVITFSLWKSRRSASGDSSDYFLAGRGLGWPVIGISIVAANISSEQMVGMSGAGAGGVGLAVSGWQLMGALFIVIVSFTLLPKFLKAGIYTMPEFLEYRYNALARGIMAAITVLIYVGVLITAVLYTGAIALHTLLDIDRSYGVWIIGAIGTVYAAAGGLKAIAYADLIQGLTLLIGGMVVFFLGLNASGGWETFTSENADKLHMVLPANHPELPWTSVVFGMWIVMIYYCGLNQFIVQRNLAAKSLKDGQLGMIFAGGLWLLVPFAIVMPGIMAAQLYDLGGKNDAAYPTLIRELAGPGLRGFIFAAIAGAVVSSLASMLNSASTVATIDVYRRLFAPNAAEHRLVVIGRALTIVFVIIGCLIAPLLTDGVFQFIQQFQGFIWPGVVAAFLGAFLLPRAPAIAGVLALVLGPLLYCAAQALTRQGFFAIPDGETANALLLQTRESGLPALVWENTAQLADPNLIPIHFLHQVVTIFCVILLIMWISSKTAPLAKPSTLPVREEMNLRTEPVVYLAGGAVITGVIAFFIVFW
jgi:solute:Na+ symporter, SSS family